MSKVPAPIEPPGGETWMDTVLSGLKSVAKVPGAVKAIARLVTSAGNAGAAWIEIAELKAEERKAEIRSDIDAKKIIAAALAKEAKGLAVSEPAVVQRSMERWLNQEVRKQVNLEAIAKVAVDELEHDPPPSDTAGPSDDWIDTFQSYAEKFSAEEFQALWGKIYASEIRHPGRISPRTMHYVSTLDNPSIELIESVLPFVINNHFIPLDAAKELGVTISTLIELENMGFGNGANETYASTFPVRLNAPTIFWKGSRGIALHFDAERTLQVPALLLTQPGKQIASIIKVQDRLDDIAPRMWTFHPKRVEIGDVQIFDGGNRARLINMAPVPNPDLPSNSPDPGAAQ